MNEHLQKLYALHLIDERLHQARQGLAALDQPPPVALQIQKIDAELAKQEAGLLKAQAALRDAELELRTLEGRKEQDSQTLYSGKVVGTRELQALEREIENLTKSISTGEGRVLEAMERIEPIQANVNKLKEYRKAADAKLASVQKEQEQARKRFQADLASVQPLRDPAAKEVEPVLLKDYEQIRTRKGHPGLAVVANSSCGVCHNSIPTFVMQDLIAEKVVHCDTCFRIYYLLVESNGG